MTEEKDIRPEAPIKLDFAIEVGGVKTDRLVMRRPKVKDQLLAKQQGGLDPQEQEIRFFANLCMVSPEEIKELDFTDYAKLQQQIEKWSPRFPE